MEEGDTIMHAIKRICFPFNAMTASSLYVYIKS